MSEGPDRIEVELVALREAAETAFMPPPMEHFRRAVQRRTHRRWGLLALVTAALVGAGGGALAVADRGPGREPRPVPTVVASSLPAPPSIPSPASSSTGSAPPAPDIRRVDWFHTYLMLPPDPDDDCPTGWIMILDARGSVGSKHIEISAAPAIGDLTGDGSPEAVVVASCTVGDLDSGDGSGHLLVITWRDGRWTGLGYLGPLGQNYPAVSISGQRLTATIEQRYGGRVQERTYRWDGQRFVQVDGPTAFPSN